MNGLLSLLGVAVVVVSIGVFAALKGNRMRKRWLSSLQIGDYASITIESDTVIDLQIADISNHGYVKADIVEKYTPSKGRLFLPVSSLRPSETFPETRRWKSEESAAPSA